MDNIGKGNPSKKKKNPPKQRHTLHQGRIYRDREGCGFPPLGISSKIVYAMRFVFIGPRKTKKKICREKISRTNRRKVIYSRNCNETISVCGDQRQNSIALHAVLTDFFLPAVFNVFGTRPKILAPPVSDITEEIGHFGHWRTDETVHEEIITSGNRIFFFYISIIFIICAVVEFPSDGLTVGMGGGILIYRNQLKATATIKSIHSESERRFLFTTIYP